MIDASRVVAASDDKFEVDIEKIREAGQPTPVASSFAAICRAGLRALVASHPLKWFRPSASGAIVMRVVSDHYAAGRWPPMWQVMGPIAINTCNGVFMFGSYEVIQSRTAVSPFVAGAVAGAISSGPTLMLEAVDHSLRKIEKPDLRLAMRYLKSNWRSMHVTRTFRIAVAKDAMAISSLFGVFETIVERDEMGLVRWNARLVGAGIAASTACQLATHPLSLVRQRPLIDDSGVRGYMLAARHISQLVVSRGAAGMIYEVSIACLRNTAPGTVALLLFEWLNSYRESMDD